MSRRDRNAKAEDYFRRAPNYSAAAYDQLRWMATASAASDPIASEVMSRVAEKLISAHKFVMPDGGTLFGPDVSPAMLENLHLPFSDVVIEFDYPSRPDDDLSGGRVRVEKRITVAWEDSRKGADGAMILPIGFSTTDAHWLPLPFILFIPYSAGEFGASLEIVPIGDVGNRTVDRFNGDCKRMAANAKTECRSVIQLCAALACTNVTTEILRPTREARAARPASTLFDYHVLMIRPGGEKYPGENRGGAHASPRTHLRRGHIRRLAWGPRIWVNSCVVNPGAIGSVDKDYAVRPSK